MNRAVKAVAAAGALSALVAATIGAVHLNASFDAETTDTADVRPVPEVR